MVEEVTTNILKENNKIIEGQSFEKIDTLSIYALADAALDKWFLKRPEHLKFKNLLAEAAGDKSAEISPHLIQLGSEYHAEWQYISKKL